MKERARAGLALALGLAGSVLQASCARDPRQQRQPGHTGPAGDTASATSPACDSGYLEDDGDCVPAACGTGTWGELQTDESTVYVDIMVAEGGDGSQAAPFTSIQAGLDAAGAAGGGLVAVAAGSYVETLELASEHDDVRLAGRCRELVVIDASAGDEGTPGIFVDVKTSQVEVSGLTVSDAQLNGVLVGSGRLTIRDAMVVGSRHIGIAAYQAGKEETTLAVESCELSGNTSAGVLALGSGTRISLRETSIHDSLCNGNGEAGFGIDVYDGASLEVESCQLEGNRAAGVLAIDTGTTVTLNQTIIRGTLPDDLGQLGFGVHVWGGASLTLQACEVRESTGLGVHAEGSGSEVELYETVVADTLPNEKGENGFGIDVRLGASLLAETCQVTGNRSAGVNAADSDTLVSLRETFVRDNLANDRGQGGYAINAHGGSRVAGESCELSGNTGAGVVAMDSGTSVELSETVIRGTLPDEHGVAGQGIDVYDGANLSLLSCEVAENASVGVLVYGLDSTATLWETSILDTLPDGSGNVGYGIAVLSGASLQAENSEVAGNRAAGIVAAHSGSQVTLWDTTVAATRRAETYTVGQGVAAQQGAQIEATGLQVCANEGPGLYAIDGASRISCSRCTLADNHFAGAVVVAEASLELVDSLVEGTVADENLGGGTGIFCQPWLGAPPSLAVTGCGIQDNPIAGVWLAGEGSYSFSGSTIRGGEGWTRQGLTKCGDAVHARAGVGAWDGSAGLLLEGNELRDGLGAGLFLDEASATLSENSYGDNAVDLIAQGSGCEEPPEGYEGEDLASVELCPAYDYATCGDEFRLYLELAEPELGYDVAPAPRLQLGVPPLPAPPRLLPLACH